MLNGTSDSGHFCLLPYLKGKAFCSFIIKLGVRYKLSVTVFYPIEEVPLYS